MAKERSDCDIKVRIGARSLRVNLLLYCLETICFLFLIKMLIMGVKNYFINDFPEFMLTLKDRAPIRTLSDWGGLLEPPLYLGN